MKWSKTKTLERLYVVCSQIGDLPRSLVVSSATFHALRGYSADADVGIRLTKDVLLAVLCPDPPDYGDHGAQEEFRNNALAALEWAERWVEVRRKDNWGDAVCLYLDSRLSELEQRQNT